MEYPCGIIGIRNLAESLLHLDLVIVDVLGYPPFSSSGGALLFHLLSKLYERKRELTPTVDGVRR